MKKIIAFTRKVIRKLYYWINMDVFSEGTNFMGIPKVRGKKNLKCGKRLNVNYDVLINAGGGVEIGDDVTLSDKVTIVAASYDVEQWCNLRRIHDNKRIRIGNHVWICANATVLQGVTICDNVIIAAGAVVNRDITEPWSIYAGIPAEKVKDIKCMKMSI